MEFDSKKLEIGSKVIVCGWNYGKREDNIGVVEKITPSGLIDIRYRGSVTRFKRNGTLYSSGSVYYRPTLKIPTGDDLVRVRLEEEKRFLVRKFESHDWSKYSHDKLKRINSILVEVQ